MKSIGFKLNATMLSIILIGIMITVSVSVAITGGVITQESLAKIERGTENEANKLDIWFEVHQANINTLASVISHMDNAGAGEVQNLLNGVMDSFDVYNNVYMGFETDEAVLGLGSLPKNFTESLKPTHQGWYKTAIADPDAIHISLPYVDALTNQPCITVSRAVLHDGQLIGVIAADILLSEMTGLIEHFTIDGEGYAMLLGSDGDLLVNHQYYAPSAGHLYANIKTIESGAYAKLWQEILEKDEAHLSAPMGVREYYTSVTIPTSGWHLVSVIPESIVTQPIHNVIWIVILISLAIAAAATIIIRLYVKNVISAPIVPFTAFMRKAGTTGDISLKQVDIDAIGKFAGREDEIGYFISATAGFVGHVQKISEALEVVANGDLSVDFTPLSDADTLGASLRKVTENLNRMFIKIDSSSGQVATDAKQMAHDARIISLGSREQTTTIEQLSSSIIEIAQKAKNSADLAGSAALLSDTIKGKAEKGSRQMDEMLAAVMDISQASQNINKAIKIIDEIAYQTNILALNAAVEAARAGSHGKGFSVVAEEVRNLAKKSSQAAKDTDSIINSSLKKTELGAAIAKETAVSLKEIVEDIIESNKLVGEIAMHSKEQSTEIELINKGIDQAKQIVLQESTAVQESAMLTEEMTNHSVVLEKLVSQFKLRDIMINSSVKFDKQTLDEDEDEYGDAAYGGAGYEGTEYEGNEYEGTDYKRTGYKRTEYVDSKYDDYPLSS